MKKLIPFILLFVGTQSIAQIRIQGANQRGSVSIEVGGNTNYRQDIYNPRYVQPYHYLRLSPRQEDRIHDLIYSLESRRLSQRAYDDILHRDLSRILDRKQFALWQDRYYTPKYRQHKVKPHPRHRDVHYGKRDHHDRDWRNRRG